MTGHNARAVRRASGWKRWFAKCSCGWWLDGSGKHDAERLADEHQAAT